MTIIINVLGSSRSGKTTTVTGLAYLLMKSQFKAAIVPSYAERRQLDGKRESHVEIPALLGKQWNYESILHGVYDIAVTLAPLPLISFYETHRHNTTYSLPFVRQWMREAEKHGVTYLNFLIEPLRIDGAEDPESHEEASALKAWLDENEIPYTQIGEETPDARVARIFDHVKSLIHVTEDTPSLSTCADARGEGFKPGYHVVPIKKGVLGELSKVQEELDEARDAEGQGVDLMVLIELSDLLGAVRAYVEKKFPGFSLKTLTDMDHVTKRAFMNGRRK